jgi:hypothetical protein
LLQPLDVVLFRSCKKAHRDILNEAMQSCCANFDKIEFLHVLKRIRNKAFSSTSIASAFRKTGIYPLNPDVVLSQLSSDKAATPTPEEKKDEVAEDAISPTSTSARTLKRYADKIRTTDMPEHCRALLAPFLKGSVALATSEALAYQQLETRTDAQNERAKRQQRTKKVLPTFGVVTVEDAKRKIKEQEEKEKKKKDSETKKKEVQERREKREQKKAEIKEQNRLQREKNREERKRAREEGKLKKGLGRNSEQKKANKMTKQSSSSKNNFTRRYVNKIVFQKIQV